MYILKGCAKCKGDLCPEKDMYGSYLRCLQCGRITDIAPLETVVSKRDKQSEQKQAA